MLPNVIETIVDNNFCIGCGLCAAICPKENLKIGFNRFGEFNASGDKNCNCGLCLKVCPFYSNNSNEDDLAETLFAATPKIQHKTETGYYLNSYAGYSNVNKHRQNGASGGLTTWLLEALLKTNKVDAIITAKKTGNPDKLFEYSIIDTVEEVRQSASSVYYPLELSEVFHTVLKTDLKYAIVGLPCFLKAVRLAAVFEPIIQDRIKFHVGLVCGQTKSLLYTSYLSKLAGVADEIINVNYRKKNHKPPSSNFKFEARDRLNNTNTILWNNGVERAWVNRWFTPNACNYCDDIFAELAEITFMDAWLPEFVKDSLGTNLCICRSHEINDLLHYGIKNNDVTLKEIDISKIISSQKGVIETKREHLKYRIYLSKLSQQYVPLKRVMGSARISIKNKIDIKCKNMMQIRTKLLFPFIFTNLEYFHNKLKLYMLLQVIISKINSLFIHFENIASNLIRVK